MRLCRSIRLPVLACWVLARNLCLHAAAPATYLTDVWTADNGLPDSSVTAIAQTRDGYLWVGTYNGLARFDGVRFVIFDPANKPGLRHARVRKLFVDAQGTLWINTYDGSLTTCRDGHFSLEWTGGGTGDGDAVLVSSSSNSVTFLLGHGYLETKSLSAPPEQGWQQIEPPSRNFGALCCGDNEGNVWYRGRDRRLSRLRGGQFDILPDSSGLLEPHVNCMTTDPSGRLWVGTDREVAFWNGHQFENAFPTNSESSLGANFLYFSQDRHLWAVTGERVQEAFNGCWEREIPALRSFFTGNLSKFGAQSDHVGGAWLYDYGKGLFHIDGGGQVQRLNPEDGFPGERVACFFEDQEGNAWAGLELGGLVRVRVRRFQVLSAESAPAKAARSVSEDSNGAVWVGTLGHGLERWQDGTVSSFSVPGGSDKGFAFCACPDRAGRLWVSAGDEDLFLLSDGLFARVSPAVHGVKAILADSSGRIWAGTKSGLFMVQPAPVVPTNTVGNTQPSAAIDFKINEGVGRRDIRALAEDKNATIWAGTGDGLLFRIGKDGVTSFQPSTNRTAPAIWSLLADRDGSIWAGTFRGGLLHFNAGNFQHFDERDGLPDSIICQILDDAQGNLWLGSHHGVFRVAKSALEARARDDSKLAECILYGRSDGLPSIECSSGYQPSAWRAHDGRLWFATLGGVVSVQPGELRANSLPPPVVIEEILVDGKTQTIENETRTAFFSSSVPALRIPSGRRQFEFRYTGLSLASSERVQFRYRLEGADNGWVEAGTRRFAQYSLLPPGDYRFQVIAGNSDNVWNREGSTVSLRVLPHFYETWTFRALAGLLAAGGLAGAVRYTVTRRLRLQLEQLERQRAIERERTRIAKDIHDDLGAGLTQITLLSELARSGPAPEHEAHLGQISDAARELTRGMDEIVWAIDPSNDTLDSLAIYLSKFAQDFLRVAGIRCRLDIPEDMPPRPLRAEIRHNLFLAVKEALNNLVKHSQATEVYLRLVLEGQGFTLVIEDNGRGFVTAAAGSSKDDSGRIHSGHGLGNLGRRLGVIGGQCLIRSETGKGTRIEMSLPSFG